MKPGYSNDGQQPYDKVITDQDNEYNPRRERAKNREYYKLGFPRNKSACNVCGFYVCKCKYRKALSVLQKNKCVFYAKCEHYNLHNKRCTAPKDCMIYWDKFMEKTNR